MIAADGIPVVTVERRSKRATHSISGTAGPCGGRRAGAILRRMIVIGDDRINKERAMDRLCAKCIAEALGTFILVLFGCGSVAAAVITHAQSGLWQVAVVWGFGVSMAIYTTGAISGAHINPAVTVTMAIFRKQEFPLRNIVPYLCSQVLGAFAAAAVVYALFRESIAHFESVNNIVRGEAGSQLSAMLFGEYFPNPAMYGTTQDSFAQVSLGTACMAELVGTACLLFFVFALTDRKNTGSPKGETQLSAYFIGVTVAILISILAPLTQACLNPARDFGPRLFSYLAGWDHIAIPGPRGGYFLVYIFSPILGGITGGYMYHAIYRRLYAVSDEDHEENRENVPSAEPEPGLENL